MWLIIIMDSYQGRHAGFHPENFFAGDMGVTVSRTVSPLPPVTIDIDSDVFWYITEVLRGFI